MHSRVRFAWIGAVAAAMAACGTGGRDPGPVDAGSDVTATGDSPMQRDAGDDSRVDTGSSDLDTAADEAIPTDGSTSPDVIDGTDAIDASASDTGAVSDTAPVDAACPAAFSGATGCYASVCSGIVHTLQDNRDRLIADLARRKCTTSCTLWAALNMAERYIFLMDTAYFGAPASRLYPAAAHNGETALDHAVALYSINGPLAGQGVDGSGRGGNDYNRIYLGFDSFATCVLRNFAGANPTRDPAGNQWQTSDDLAGAHAPFTQREMILWYRAVWDPQSEGPQFHLWHQDSDFTQSGINQRLGVCGVTDRALVEATIAFDTYHNSDPLGDYAGRGGYGWQIVDMHAGINANWTYTPSNCAATPPVNNDPYGGGTFAGMGPSAMGSGCTAPVLGDAGACH